MNNLSANYERLLEILRKISKEQLLTYQRRKPKMSDLELISLSLTLEYMSIIAKMIYLGNFQRLFLIKLSEVFIIEDEENY